MENNVCSRAIDALKAHFHHHPRPMILTGAGCSTGSGIADYRDKNGNWKHSPPVLFNDFVKNEATRKRYWARSMHGWPRIANAEPNAAHIALARLDAGGFIHQIITQNIDGLHQKAGSNNVIDLHGKLDSVKCIDCGYQTSRHTYQTILLEWNPNFKSRISVSLPDGDACLAAQDYSSFRFPECPACGGIYKPDVIFFGEFIPRQRIANAMGALETADSLIIIGSSLMVLSGYRFCQAARKQGKPVISINIGRSRADGEFSLKIEEDCGQILMALAEQFEAPRWCNNNRIFM